MTRIGRSRLFVASLALVALGLRPLPAGADYIVNLILPSGATYSQVNVLTNSGVAAGVYLNLSEDPLVAHYYIRDPSGTITDWTAGSVAAINSSGEVAGLTGSGNQTVPYVSTPSGAVTTFVPGDPARYGFTSTMSLNDSGQVVGQYGTNDNRVHVFLRDPSGVVTTIDPPGSNDTFLQFLPGVHLLNNLGQVIVNNFPLTGGSQLSLRDPSGAYTTISPFGFHPDLAFLNNLGQVAGDYTVAGVTHGFVRDPSGVYTTTDPPGSTGSMVETLNDRGQVAGDYTVGGQSHGFVRDPSGAIVSFDLPGSIFVGVNTLNNRGQVLGFYGTADLKVHIFVRDPSGAISSFDLLPYLLDRNHLLFNDLGDVAGYAAFSSDSVGFIAIPAAAVPEPASLVTLALGMLGLAVYRWLGLA